MNTDLIPDYLTPDFNAKTLKVADLMRILTEHNVDLPPTKQKKEVYLTLFTEHIANKRDKILKEREKEQKKMRRQTFSFESEKEERKRRRSMHAVAHTPEVKEEQQESGLDQSFTTENVFQSESEHERKKSDTKRRKSFGQRKIADSVVASPQPFMFKVARTPLASFAQTENNLEFHSEQQKSASKVSSTPLTSRSSLGDRTPQQVISPSAGYTLQTPKTTPPPFTPENRAEAKKIKNPKEKLFDISFLNLSFLIFTLAILGRWYLVNRDSLAYCTSENQKGESFFKLPICISCPRNAECVDKTIVSCPPNYSLSPRIIHRYISPKYLPFPFSQPVCALDKQKFQDEAKFKQRLEKLILVADQATRKLAGRIECGDRDSYSNVFENGKVVGVPGELVVQEISRGAKSKIRDFDKLWSALLENAAARSDLPIRSIRRNGQLLLVSKHPAIITASCRWKKSISGFFMNYITEISSSILAVFLIILSIRSRSNYIQETRQVNKIVQEVLAMIHSESEKHIKNPVLHPIPGLSVTQLRDYFFPSTVHSDMKKRNKIWERVTKIVLKNSSVRESMMDLKGDMHSVWQWVASSTLKPVKK